MAFKKGAKPPWLKDSSKVGGTPPATTSPEAPEVTPASKKTVKKKGK